jgi:hypothetical protein
MLFQPICINLVVIRCRFGSIQGLLSGTKRRVGDAPFNLLHLNAGFRSPNPPWNMCNPWQPPEFIVAIRCVKSIVP